MKNNFEIWSIYFDLLDEPIINFLKAGEFNNAFYQQNIY